MVFVSIRAIGYFQIAAVATGFACIQKINAFMLVACLILSEYYANAKKNIYSCFSRLHCLFIGACYLLL